MTSERDQVRQVINEESLLLLSALGLPNDPKEQIVAEYQIAIVKSFTKLMDLKNLLNYKATRTQ